MKKEPMIRIKGFFGEWENYILGEENDVRDGTHDSPKFLSEGYPLVTSKNLGTMGLNLDNVSFISQEDFDDINKRSKVDYGDILLGLIGTIGNPVLVEQIGYAIKNVGLIRNNGKLKNEFLLPYLKSPNIENNLLQQATGNTQKFLGLSVLRSLNITAPTSKEQTALGEFFRQLDNVLAHSKQKHQKLSQFKQAMLGKMFPKKGETVPEVRIGGFCGEWKECKLGEVVKIVGGGTPSTTIPGYWNGDIDWYSPTEIGHSVYVEKSNRQITELGLQKSSATILPANKTVLFTSRASIGDMAILRKAACTNQGFQSFVLDEKTDVYFLYSLGSQIKNLALAKASGSTFLEISKTQLAEILLYFPTPEEQTAIGEFFRQLDNQLTLLAQQIAKFSQIKTALLAKMFV